MCAGYADSDGYSSGSEFGTRLVESKCDGYTDHSESASYAGGPVVPLRRLARAKHGSNFSNSCRTIPRSGQIECNMPLASPQGDTQPWREFREFQRRAGYVSAGIFQAIATNQGIYIPRSLSPRHWRTRGAAGNPRISDDKKTRLGESSYKKSPASFEAGPGIDQLSTARAAGL